MNNTNISIELIRILENLLQCKLDNIDPTMTYAEQSVGMDSLLYLQFLSEIERIYGVELDNKVWESNQKKTISELSECIEFYRTVNNDNL